MKLKRFPNIYIEVEDEGYISHFKHFSICFHNKLKRKHGPHMCRVHPPKTPGNSSTRVTGFISNPKSTMNKQLMEEILHQLIW